MICGRRQPKARAIVSTHTPGGWTEPGQRYTDRDGVEWVVTGIKSLAPTALRGGGLHPCWDVYGIRTSNDHEPRRMSEDEAMHVWVLLAGDYECEEILGVYAAVSPAKAAAPNAGEWSLDVADRWTAPVANVAGEYYAVQRYTVGT